MNPRDLIFVEGVIARVRMAIPGVPRERLGAKLIDHGLDPAVVEMGLDRCYGPPSGRES